VVTGATSGIGEATARRFVNEGARVVVVGRNEVRGHALAAELGDAAVFVKADVAHDVQVGRAVDAAVDRFGRLDCLFNNAGAALPGEIETITEAEFDAAMRTLLGSVMFGMKHADRVMSAAGGGAIINNSSIAALRTGQGGFVYSVAEAAVTHATRLATVEFGPGRIRVNAISPGAIATPIFWGGSEISAQLSDDENERKQAKLERSLARATPTPRSGVPEDIAAAAVYLASDEAAFLNGVDLVVDGGRVWAYHERPREAKSSGGRA
jgi:NAD(P)-dependent dehydrogenase (short-subunit alcohol dehydrogenase family)